MTSETVEIKVIVGGMVGDIPRGIESAEDFGLDTLDALDVDCTPQLNAISPRRFEDGFVNS
jgi:hypothetical protein